MCLATTACVTTAAKIIGFVGQRLYRISDDQRILLESISAGVLAWEFSDPRHRAHNTVAALSAVHLA